MTTDITTSLPESQLTRCQSQTIEVSAPYKGCNYHRINTRFDDRCGNGHNTFSITMDSYRRKSFYTRYGTDSILASGKQHGAIAKLCPQLEPYLKWHLVSTDGPMHYVANTTYWLREGNYECARNSAVWPQATDGYLAKILQERTPEDILLERLPDLMQLFKHDMETLGFIY
ncbi:MAG: hypothetical protein HC800_25525 [Phormidesmis sp. RL_2_1]|nr:hypothetical protein [Phormidesmis sp. RL_2_1]